MNPRRVLEAVVAVHLTLTASVARADESEAERLFREGRALLLDDRFAEACPKLAESNRIEPRSGTLLNLAACHEREGKIATAWVEYQKVLTTTHTEGQTQRERVARERIDALEPRVPWLSISIPGTGAAEVTLDGATIAPVAWGKEMPVDPGPHVVASAIVARPFEERFVLRESEHKTVIVVPGPRPSANEPTPMPIIVEPKPATSAPTPETSTTTRTVGFVTGGLGIAALGVGAFFAYRASATRDDFEAALNNPGATRSELDRLDFEQSTSSTIAAVTIVGGLVALGTGVVLVLVSGSSTPQRAKVSKWPSSSSAIGLRGWGLQGSF